MKLPSEGAAVPHRPTVIVLAGLTRALLEPVEAVAAMTLLEPVLVRHALDPGDDGRAGTITRVVSDASGVLEHEVVPLDRTCLTCALRFEIAPTLARLAATGRWESILLSLPEGADPSPLVRALRLMTAGGRPLADQVDLRTVVGAIAATVAADVLGDDLVCERWPGHRGQDRRAVGEVVAPTIEYADVLVLDEAVPDPISAALLDQLRRPGAELVAGPWLLEPRQLLGEPRDGTAEDWVEMSRRRPSVGEEPAPLPVVPDECRDREPHLVVEAAADSGGVWTVHVDSWRAVHPRRLMAELEVLGLGHRGRGVVWLPSRPGAPVVWDGAGGRLHIGPLAPSLSGPAAPRTRLVITGHGATERDEVLTALRRVLMTETEMVREAPRWVGIEDGFEPWLGRFGEEEQAS